MRSATSRHPTTLQIIMTCLIANGIFKYPLQTESSFNSTNCLALNWAMIVFQYDLKMTFCSVFPQFKCEILRFMMESHLHPG